MNIQTLNQTIKTLEGVRNAVGSFTRADVDLTLGLLRREVEALAEKPAPVQEQVNLHQVLTDPENQPNQYGVEFGMHGEKMMFKVGVQQFALDYEPDTQDEFNFMREMLIHAFSTFTHGVKTTPPAAQPAHVPLTKEQVRDLCKSAGYGMTSMQARADFINGIRHGEAAHGITKGGAA